VIKPLLPNKPKGVPRADDLARAKRHIRRRRRMCVKIDKISAKPLRPCAAVLPTLSRPWRALATETAKTESLAAIFADVISVLSSM
jgi:hypothetical protein